MKKMIFAAAMLAAFPLASQAQGPDYSKVQEQVTPLGHGMYALTGAGGNTTIAIGKDAIIMVDTQFAPLHDKLKAKIAGLSHLPIKYVINTHYHGDHTGGNAGFAHDGAIIIAHQAVADRLKNPPPGPNGQPGTAAPAGAIPAKTYTGEETTVTVPGVTAHLLHPAQAHTDGDSIVLWPDADVISTGDLVSTASYPNIDVASGGSIDGMIAGTYNIIAHCHATTKIVPGHGPVTNEDGLIAYRDMLVEVRQRIAKAKGSGMSEDQVVNANLLADMDAKWKPQGNAMAARFPRLVYESLK